MPMVFLFFMIFICFFIYGLFFNQTLVSYNSYMRSSVIMSSVSLCW